MSTTLTLENHILLKKIKANDINAFNVLFKKYYSLLCAYAHRYVNDDDAKEVVQEVFINFWENREQINIETSLNSYLYKMVYHKTLNHIAHLDSVKKTDSIYYQLTADMTHDFDRYDFKELKQNVLTVIEELPEAYKEAIIMHRFKDMTYNEIALQLGISPKTVDYRIQQAFKIARFKLKGYVQVIVFIY